MGEVRIIGGQWKRSKLPVPDLPGLRPTSDRIRETLFNWLGQTLTGWRVLDAFAGSGALGFEAASRWWKGCGPARNACRPRPSPFTGLTP
jgi:16S rRNA (guanine966-N2)-methyltransferase